MISRICGKCEEVTVKTNFDYPKGLAGEEIPMIARMICVADAFDTMNSNRVYRKKLTKESIIKEIESNKGTQFDPDVADVMLKLLHSSNSLFDM